MCTHACTLAHIHVHIHIYTYLHSHTSHTDTHAHTHMNAHTCTHTHNVPCRSGQVKLKPVVIDDYNQHMLGVNKLDQFASYYSFLHKSVKWWRKVFFWMLEVAAKTATDDPQSFSSSTH